MLERDCGAEEEDIISEEEVERLTYELVEENDYAECEAYGHALDGPDREGVPSCFCGAVKYYNGLERAKKRLEETAD